MTLWTKALTAVPFFAAPRALRAAPSSAPRWRSGATLACQSAFWKSDFYDFFNQTRKAEIRVDIEDYSVSSPEALTRLQKNCCLSYNPVATDC